MPTGPGMLLADVAEAGNIASVMTAVCDSLRSWVGVGPVFLASADPLSGTFTDTFTFDIPEVAAAAFFAIEMAGRDVGSFKSLAGSASPTGSLFGATNARPQASERWRDVIEPLGWGDELRAVVRSHGLTWGYLCVHREAADRPFAAREVKQLDALLPAVAAAMRRTALSRSGDNEDLRAGVVLIDGQGRVAGATGGAAAWLDELGPRLAAGLPLLLAGIAAAVFERGLPVSSTITTRAGHIGVVEAAPLRGGSEPQVAIVMGPAPAIDRLGRFAAAGRLTAREQDIVACVVDGMATKEIAERLGISPHTVQAHLTSVFGKTGLRSRRELITRLSRR
jgi:DNA-binding CsgD family transcriptional regulator